MSLADSGGRKEFNTGAVREEDDSRPRPELISPYALERIALHYARGAKKYAPRNWEAGLPFVDTIGSMFRHIIKFMLRDESEDHLAAIAWNAFALMHYEGTGQAEELDDRPNYVHEE